MILTKKYEKLWLENFFFKILYMEIGFNHNNFQDTTTQDVNNDKNNVYIYVHILQENLKKSDTFVYICRAIYKEIYFFM